ATIHGKKIPIMPIAPLYGTGCGSRGSDHPISRDQYSGVFMGLAYAWELVPDLRSRIAPLVDRALAYLVHSPHPWDVELPPDPTTRNDFLSAYRILRAATATHRNAWFDLVDILVNSEWRTSPSASNPLITLENEIQSDLNDWKIRWDYVKNSEGMPTNVTSAA